MSIGKITVQVLGDKPNVIPQQDRQDGIKEGNEDKQRELQGGSQNKEQTKEELKKIVGSLNKFIEPSKTHVKFELHEKSEEYIVKVIDDRTSEIIREIPSEEWLDYYAAMTDFLGLIVDKKI